LLATRWLWSSENWRASWWWSGFHRDNSKHCHLLIHLFQKIQQQCEDKWAQKVFVLHDNIKPHTSHQTTQILRIWPCQIMPCLTRWKIHRMVTDSLMTASWCIRSQKSGLLHLSGTYQKMAVVHWP
jgi:hypothetical protein